MAILHECPVCRARCALSVVRCTRCGNTLPKQRAYWIRYTIKDGGARRDKWERLGVVSHGVARSVYERRLQAEREGQLLPKDEIPTLGDIWERYLQRTERQSPGWHRNVRTQTEKFIAEWGKDTPASELTPQNIEELRSKLWRAGAAPGSIDVICATGKAAWNHYPTKVPNPFNAVKPYRPDNTITEFLTEDEEARLLSVARDRQPMLHDILVVALATGLRMANVLSLRRDQVNFDFGLIRVKQKGNREHVSIINDRIRDLLAAIPPVDGSPHFWVNPDTGRPYISFRKTFKSLLRAAGITRRFRWHDLRHTTGSRIVQAGLGLQMAKEVLGHRNLSTTLRYAHLDLASKKRAAEITSPNVVTTDVTKSANRLIKSRKSNG